MPLHIILGLHPGLLSHPLHLFLPFLPFNIALLLLPLLLLPLHHFLMHPNLLHSLTLLPFHLFYLAFALFAEGALHVQGLFEAFLELHFLEALALQLLL